MQLIKAYKTEAKIKGLTKTVLISIEVENETDVDLSYMDETERAKTERQLERGFIDCLWVKVTARWSGLSHFEGVDSLGQVFATKPGDIEETVSEYDMSQNAIDELIKETLTGVSQIETFLGKVA